MTQKIHLYGQLAEAIGQTELDWPEQPDTTTLLASLKDVYPQLEKLNFALAVNRRLVQGNQPVPEGAEVALLPPFSGG